MAHKTKQSDLGQTKMWINKLQKWLIASIYLQYYIKFFSFATLMNPALLFRVSRCSPQLFRYVIVSPKSLPFCFVSFFSNFLFSGVFLGCTALWSLRANIHLLKSVYQDCMFMAKIIITVIFNQYWNRRYLFSNNCSLILEIKWFYCTFTSVQIFASF